MPLPRSLSSSLKPTARTPHQAGPRIDIIAEPLSSVQKQGKPVPALLLYSLRIPLCIDDMGGFRHIPRSTLACLLRCTLSCHVTSLVLGAGQATWGMEGGEADQGWCWWWLLGA